MASAAAEDIPRLLVVDDQIENINLLISLLGPKGYHVTSALGGVDALAQIREAPPDVVLLDLVMPDIDGYEVCRQLKMHAATRHIPVVFITGLSDREANIKAIELGADDFVTKPFDPALLEVRIRSCLRVKRLQDRIIRYQRLLEGRNESLVSDLEKRMEEIERIQHVTVFSLSKLAESRDTDTGEHLNRICAYSQEVTLNLLKNSKFVDIIDEKFIHDIYLSSSLHDIGKVGIPDCILLKPDKLTFEEFEIMKTHATIGGDTLKAADKEAGQHSFLAMGRDIAYSHHEKWDGNGYPSGLRGEDIPLPARIVAVCDVYDALSSKRPYKEAFSHEKSMGIIREGRGTHFDPDVLDAFLLSEPRILEIRSQFYGSGELPALMRQVQSLAESIKLKENAAAPAAS